MSEEFEFGIIGMGPAGIGLAMSLCNTTESSNIICFERGYSTAKTSCAALAQKPCCNSDICTVISGIGGASTFSSGKISDYPAGKGLVYFFDSEQQLKELLRQNISYLGTKIALKMVQIDEKLKTQAREFYAQQGINYKYYDVYEFDGDSYQVFLQKTIDTLKNKGIRILNNTNVVSIDRKTTTSSFCVRVKTPNDEKTFLIHKLVLAIGALDIQDRLIEQVVKTTKNNYEIGLRVEAPCDVFHTMLSSHGDLKLKYDSGRTYCVTANGKIITYRTGKSLFLEGCISPSNETNLTNLAVLVKCEDNEKINKFIKQYQEKFYGYPVKQTLIDYINRQTSTGEIETTLSSASWGDINDLFSNDINNAIKDFISKVLLNAMHLPKEKLVVVAPELKILRDLNLRPNFELDDNLFIIGAATGKFRGILQSFCSGLRCGQLLDRSQRE